MTVQRLTVLISEHYWAVCFGVAPYIDRETHIFPECTNNRGLHMVSLQLNMSRTELALFWGHVEAGTHLDQTCPFMTHQKVHRVEVKLFFIVRHKYDCNLGREQTRLQRQLHI